MKLSGKCSFISTVGKKMGEEVIDYFEGNENKYLIIMKEISYSNTNILLK
jgi:hypothetical protein